MAGVYTGSKWGEPGLGNTGGEVSWSFASFAGRLVEFEYAFIERPFQHAIRLAFQAWEDVADIDFIEVADSFASAIRVGWENIDGPGRTLGQAVWQHQGARTVYSEIAFDTGENWNVAGASSSGGPDFFAVAIHEIGHSIGLSHFADPESIMHAFLGSQTELTGPDVAAIQVLYGPAEATVQIPAVGLDPVGGDGTSIFRFYNSDTGVHFYTASEAERDIVKTNLPQFVFEGSAFSAASEDQGDLEIFRFLNEDTGAHFYTASAEERDQIMRTLDSYSFEGSAYKAYSSSEGGEREALYRFYNTDTNTHFYTTDEEEMANVVGTLPQFQLEGIAYYVEAY